MWHKNGDALLQEIDNSTAHNGEALLWFLGQMGFVVKINGITLYFDPLLNDFTDELGVRRSYPPPFLPEAVKADYVLCSHDHADHLNLETLLPIAKNSAARFIVPDQAAATLRNAGIADDRIIAAHAPCRSLAGGLPGGGVAEDKLTGIPIPLEGGLVIIPIAAAHTEYQCDANGDSICLGYVLRTLEGGGVKPQVWRQGGDFPPLSIYHAGDTLATRELIAALKSLAPIHVAIVPVNGSDWERADVCHLAGNMHCEDAAKLARAINAELCVPAHYDMMSDNAVNPAFFAEAMRRLCPAQKYHIFAPGERFVFRR